MKWRPASTPGVVDLDDVRVDELGDRERLAAEAGDELLVVGEVLGEDLDGDGALEDPVGRPVDRRHPAPAEPVAELVAAGEGPPRSLIRFPPGRARADAAGRGFVALLRSPPAAASPPCLRRGGGWWSSGGAVSGSGCRVLPAWLRFLLLRRFFFFFAVFFFAFGRASAGSIASLVDSSQLAITSFSCAGPLLAAPASASGRLRPALRSDRSPARRASAPTQSPSSASCLTVSRLAVISRAVSPGSSLALRRRRSRAPSRGDGEREGKQRYGADEASGRV